MWRWIRAIGVVVAVIVIIAVAYLVWWFLIALFIILMVWALARAQEPRKGVEADKEAQDFISRFGRRK